jgi:hypothetical protein
VICVVLLALAGPASGQEIRPTLDKIKETGVVQLGYRETSRPFSFRGNEGEELPVTVLRGDKIVELKTIFTGF